MFTKATSHLCLPVPRCAWVRGSVVGSRRWRPVPPRRHVTKGAAHQVDGVELLHLVSETEIHDGSIW